MLGKHAHIAAEPCDHSRGSAAHPRCVICGRRFARRCVICFASRLHIPLIRRAVRSALNKSKGFNH